MRQPIRFSMNLLAAAALVWGVGMSVAAAPKATPTPPAIEGTVGPASGKTRIPEVDFRPVRIDIVRSEGDVYYARVAYECRSNVPLRSGVEIDVGMGMTPELRTEPAALCGTVRQTSEFRLNAAARYTVRVDPYRKIKETNEGNNVCVFNRASFGTGTQYVCP
jgi:hypothetical protein